MSSDPELERLLRDAGATLPEPDAGASSRARILALSSVRRQRPRRLRLVALVGIALVLALSFGVGVGALVAPRGEAAKGPVGLGFVPEPGWFALQSRGKADAVYQTIAVASNIPFAREDDIGGFADASGLPYATLLALPADGIVLVASFLRLAPLNTVFFPSYDEQKLPLRLKKATPFVYGATQIRPEAPLAQYQLRAAVNGHYVEILAYFGTEHPTQAMLASAQRQLAGLVVGKSAQGTTALRRPTTSRVSAAPTTIDRTFSCAPSFVGGVRQVEARAHRGTGRGQAGWDRPPFAAVSTSVAGSVFEALSDELVWITAGRPAPTAVVETEFKLAHFLVRGWGTIAVNRERCRATSKRVPFGAASLVARPIGPFADRYDCTTPRRILVRVRAATQTSSLRSYRTFLRTTTPVKEATLVVRTEAGKPLVYAHVVETGKSVLYTAPSCIPD